MVAQRAFPEGLLTFPARPFFVPRWTLRLGQLLRLVLV